MKPMKQICGLKICGNFRLSEGVFFVHETSCKVLKGQMNTCDALQFLLEHIIYMWLILLNWDIPDTLSCSACMWCIVLHSSTKELYAITTLIVEWTTLHYGSLTLIRLSLYGLCIKPKLIFPLIVSIYYSTVRLEPIILCLINSSLLFLNFHSLFPIACLLFS